VKKFFIGLYMFTIYLLCLVLAVVSAGFTTVFYISGAEGISQVLIGLLAVVLESIKIILAFVFPFMAGRQGAETIRRVLNACLILSIIASLNFFMGLGTSPASGFVSGIYELLGIDFGKKIMTFFLNMTLAVIIEVFVIHVPRFAHIFSANKMKSYTPGCLTKLISIPRVLIERKVDQWVELVNPRAEIHELENEPEKIELLENPRPLELEIEESKIELEGARENPLDENVEVENPRPEIHELENEVEEIEPEEVEDSIEIEAPAQGDTEDYIEVSSKVDVDTSSLEDNPRAEIVHNISGHSEPEKWKGLVKDPSSLMEALISIKDAENIIRYSSRELEEAFSISSWNLRMWKKVLASEGKILARGNKIKVVA
jgi:hypothetical protein